MRYCIVFSGMAELCLLKGEALFQSAITLEEVHQHLNLNFPLPLQAHSRALH